MRTLLECLSPPSACVFMTLPLLQSFPFGAARSPFERSSDALRSLRRCLSKLVDLRAKTALRAPRSTSTGELGTVRREESGEMLCVAPCAPVARAAVGRRSRPARSRLSAAQTPLDRPLGPIERRSSVATALRSPPAEPSGDSP